jgi:hypothetical protein
MSNPYENIVVGSFLYGLGLCMGARRRRFDGCVNLLQQTPLDRPLGDVLVHYPGTLRLLEFKRQGADMIKERTKLEVLKGALSRDPHLEAVSRAVHSFVRSQTSEAPTARIGVRPYLDFDVKEASDTSLDAFSEAIIAEAFESPRFDTAALNDYLHAVATFSGVTDLQSPGMLVTVDGGGCLRYTVVEDFLDLRATAEILLERARQAKHQREPELDRPRPERSRAEDPDRQLQPERTRDDGRSR